MNNADDTQERAAQARQELAKARGVPTSEPEAPAEGPDTAPPPPKAWGALRLPGPGSQQPKVPIPEPPPPPPGAWRGSVRPAPWHFVKPPVKVPEVVDPRPVPREHLIALATSRPVPQEFRDYLRRLIELDPSYVRRRRKRDVFFDAILRFCRLQVPKPVGDEDDIDEEEGSYPVCLLSPDVRPMVETGDPLPAGRHPE